MEFSGILPPGGIASPPPKAPKTPGRRAPLVSLQTPPRRASILEANPWLSALWHPRKNKRNARDSLVGGSLSHSFWYKCRHGPDHEWEEKLSELVQRGAADACPCCAGRRCSSTNSVAAMHAAAAAMWHPTKNGGLRPTGVVAATTASVWFLCPRGPDHEWCTRPAVAAREGCPCCAGRKSCASNSVAAQGPAAAQLWHPTKNVAPAFTTEDSEEPELPAKPLRPESVVAGTAKKLWFYDPLTGHEFCQRVTTMCKPSLQDDAAALAAAHVPAAVREAWERERDALDATFEGVVEALMQVGRKRVSVTTGMRASL